MNVEVIGKSLQGKDRPTLVIVIHCDKCQVSEHYLTHEASARSAHIEEHRQYTRIEYKTKQ